MSIIRNMSNSRIFDPQQLADVFKALSNPNRLSILARLARCCAPGTACGSDAEMHACCVGELGQEVSLAPSTVSHHIKELRSAGLIRVERRGQSVECQLDREMVRAVADYLSELTED